MRVIHCRVTGICSIAYRNPDSRKAGRKVTSNAIWLAAKAAGLLLYLLAVELVTVPVFAAFFLDDAAALGPLCLVLVLADVGICASGALISSRENAAAECPEPQQLGLAFAGRRDSGKAVMAAVLDFSRGVFERRAGLIPARIL